MDSLSSAAPDEAHQQHDVLRKIRTKLGARIKGDVLEDAWNYRQTSNGARLSFSVAAAYENDPTVKEDYVVIEQGGSFRLLSAHFRSEQLGP